MAHLLPLAPWPQVLPVVCVISCVFIYWLAEWTLRRIDPDGGLLPGCPADWADAAVACTLLHKATACRGKASG